MDNKGFVFTVDLLLAIIIITVGIGMAIAQYESLNYQMQDFTGRQSLEKTVNDAADYMVKTAGKPVSWHDDFTPDCLPGLAYMSNIGPNNNFLNPRKMSKLKAHPELISNLVNSPNYNLIITRVDNYEKVLEISSQNPNIASSSAKEVAVANRTVTILTNETLLRMNDLMHINPANPGIDNGYIWYNKSGDSDYVGPGNKTTAQNANSSFYVTANFTNDYDYYIYVDENYVEGKPSQQVNVLQYGFTDGDAVVNGTYGAIDDKSRDDAIRDELNKVYHESGNTGWQKLPDTTVTSKYLVNHDIQTALDYYNDPDGDLKLWIYVKSDPKAHISISLIQVPHGQQPFQRIPAKFVLKIWE